MKGQLKNIEGIWYVIPNWIYKDILKETKYLLHPNQSIDDLEEIEVEFEIVKFKKSKFAFLGISFTKPGFVERRILQMKSIKNK